MAGGYQGAIPNMRVMIAVAPALKRTLRARERERESLYGGTLD